MDAYFFSVYDFIGFDGWANFFNLELPERAEKKPFFSQLVPKNGDRFTFMVVHTNYRVSEVKKLAVSLFLTTGLCKF